MAPRSGKKTRRKAKTARRGVVKRIVRRKVTKKRTPKKKTVKKAKRKNSRIPSKKTKRAASSKKTKRATSSKKTKRATKKAKRAKRKTPKRKTVKRRRKAARKPKRPSLAMSDNGISPPITRGAAAVSKGPMEESEDDTDPPEWEVERIVNFRMNKKEGTKEFMVKWKGYPHSENTWEPEANLTNCQATVEDFYGQLEFMVEEIVDQRQTEDGLQFLVKWKGWSDEDNTWDFRDDLLDEKDPVTGAPEALERFLRKTATRSTPGRRPGPRSAVKSSSKANSSGDPMEAEPVAKSASVSFRADDEQPFHA